MLKQPLSYNRPHSRTFKSILKSVTISTVTPSCVLFTRAGVTKIQLSSREHCRKFWLCHESAGPWVFAVESYERVARQLGKQAASETRSCLFRMPRAENAKPHPGSSREVHDFRADKAWLFFMCRLPGLAGKAHFPVSVNPVVLEAQSLVPHQSPPDTVLSMSYFQSAEQGTDKVPSLLGWCGPASSTRTSGVLPLRRSL